MSPNKAVRWIDTHCHLNHKDLMKSLAHYLNEAERAGVDRFVVVGWDLPSSIRAVELSQKQDNIFCAVGIHPHDATTANKHALKELKKLAQSPKVVAIGEIGLDYYRDLSPRDVQQHVFIEQYRIAEELDIPVIIHCRSAYPELLTIVNQIRSSDDYPILLHCFAGDADDAVRSAEMGLYFGIPGTLTYKKNDEYRQVVAGLPKDKIMLETDCPYLTPEPYRGKTNEPANIPIIAQQLAETLRLSMNDLQTLTTNNALRFFCM